MKKRDFSEMTSIERQELIDLLKDVARRVEAGEGDKMDFAIAVRRSDVQPQNTTCSVHGSTFALMEMISTLSEPIVKHLLQNGQIEEVERKAFNINRPQQSQTIN